jgi:hypothetical protein
MTDLLNGPTFELSPPPPIRKPWYRRAAVILPIVVALVAAAAAVTIVLVVSGDSATTPGTTTVTATPAPAPAPVRMAVTSALTGEPLAVTLGLPDGTTLSSGGSGTVAPDRVKPGDKVSVSAEGYVTAQVQVGKDRMITAILRPTFATAANQLQHWAVDGQNDKIIKFVLSPATGFQYEAIATRTDPWQVNADVVGKDRVNVNVALMPGFPLTPYELKQMFGNTAQQITIAGQPAWYGSSPETPGWFSSVWQRDPLNITVSGTDLSTTDAVLTGIVTALPVK